jgi:hypothetical protein
MEKLVDGLVQIKKMRSGYMTSKEKHELINVTELLTYLLDQQKQEISDLKNLVNELKGEQGKNDFPCRFDLSKG